MSNPKNKINWRLHFIELLVVIIGISIAFTLEGWSSDRKQKTLQVNYLNTLKADLQKDKEDLQTIIDSTNVILKNVGEVFQFIYTKRPVDAYKRHHITSSYLATYFYPQNGTYVSLINSGDINVIQDFDLKASLSDLYNVQYREVGRIDNVIKNLVDNMLQPFVINEITFSMTRDGIEDDTPLKQNKTVNMLGSFFNLLSARQRTYEQMKGICDELIASIDESLGS